jgi:aryl-alcohol dehydrogenase-like predicted oxidoreductase
MSELVESGLVRFLGLSEVTVDEIKRAAAIHPVSSIQSELSLWTRDHLAEVVPYCNEHGIGFLAYSPLGRGFLTGAIDTKAEFASDDFRAGNPRFSPEARAANIAIVERIRQVANRYGASPAQVAIAWVLRQGPGVVPIPGTKQVGYLEENVAASELELTSKDMEELDALPAPAGTRY